MRRILVLAEPAARREGEFQFVAVIAGVVRADDGGELRYVEMPQADQLVPDLLLLGLELHSVGERLPFAAAAQAEMLAERLQTVFGGLFHLDDEALHVVGFLLGDAYVDDVTGDR